MGSLRGGWRRSTSTSPLLFPCAHRHKNVFHCVVFWTVLWQMCDMYLPCFGQSPRELDWVDVPRDLEEDEEEDDLPRTLKRHWVFMVSICGRYLCGNCGIGALLDTLLRALMGGVSTDAFMLLLSLKLFHNGDPGKAVTSAIHLAFIYVLQQLCEEAHAQKAHHGRKTMTITHR